MGSADEYHRKPQSRREDALAVVKRLRDAGHVAYFAGGCVRDVLMGLTPADYDVATDAPPPRVRELFRNTQAVGAAFGVMLVRTGGSQIEVATFRREGAYHDGRRPSEVRFTDAREDAQRRDFTINGLFLDPINDEVIDFVGGRDDLAARRLRAIGEPRHRFEEDHLRLLRAVRFAARFALEIEPATHDAIGAAGPRLVSISPERIAGELRLMLSPPTRAMAWPMLCDLGLAKVIARFLPSLSGRVMVDSTGETTESAAPSLPPQSSVFLAIAPGAPIPFALALAGATFDFHIASGRKPAELLEGSVIAASTRGWRKALRLSNEESDQFADILASLATVLGPDYPTLATRKRFLACPDSHSSRRLAEALSSGGLWIDRIDALRPDLLELEKTEVAPPPLVTGDDLVAAGFVPGPLFRGVLERVYDAQLENRVQSRQQALELAVELARSGRGPQ
jgi:poly(A) polymerase